jgi:hypothetical protein
VLLGVVVVVVVDLVVVVVLFGTVVVVDLGAVVLVDSFGVVVLVVPLAAGVVVVLVAKGTVVVVDPVGDDGADGSVVTVPGFPEALDPPDEFAVPVVAVTKVVVVIDVPVPLKPLEGVPGFSTVVVGVEYVAVPGSSDSVRFAATASVVAVGGWWFT